MTDVATHPGFSSDPRLAAHATSTAPAWLWSTDATRVLWANAVGAAIFDAATPAALAERPFDPHHQAASQILRLAASLRPTGAARLERLRGFGTGFRMLMCACSHVPLAGHTAGILVVALEPAGPALPLAERVGRLVAGTGAAVAAFSPDGMLITRRRKATPGSAAPRRWPGSVPSASRMTRSRPAAGPANCSSVPSRSSGSARMQRRF